MLKLCLAIAAIGGALAGPLPDTSPHVPRGDALSKRSYSSDAWGGAFQEGNGFYYVEGTVQVPYVSGQNGLSASAWVGIDGKHHAQHQLDPSNLGEHRLEQRLP